ncbi:MAG: hypothetical protein J6U18_03170 [Acetobacter sp.]|nr:hypothetical protein [Acetobacter sp.]
MIKPFKVLLVTGLTFSFLTIFSLSPKAATKDPANPPKKPTLLSKS